MERCILGALGHGSTVSGIAVTMKRRQKSHRDSSRPFSAPANTRFATMMMMMTLDSELYSGIPEPNANQFNYAPSRFACLWRGFFFFPLPAALAPPSAGAALTPPPSGRAAPLPFERESFRRWAIRDTADFRAFSYCAARKSASAPCAPRRARSPRDASSRTRFDGSSRMSAPPPRPPTMRSVGTAWFTGPVGAGVHGGDAGSRITA